MTDKEIIKQAYEDAVSSLFSLLFGAYSAAADAAAKALAVEGFKKGIGLAREARDKALAVV